MKNNLERFQEEVGEAWKEELTKKCYAESYDNENKTDVIFSDILEELKTMVKNNEIEDNYIKNAINEESIYNMLVKKAQSEMLIYLKFDEFRKTDKDTQKQIINDIFEYRIHRYNMLFKLNGQAYAKKIKEVDDLVRCLSAVINFCIYQNYSMESIKYQLMDMTGIDDDIAEMLAIKVDENFDSLRLTYITENVTGLMRTEE